MQDLRVVSDCLNLSPINSIIQVETLNPVPVPLMADLSEIGLNPWPMLAQMGMTDDVQELSLQVQLLKSALLALQLTVSLHAEQIDDLEATA